MTSGEDPEKRRDRYQRAAAAGAGAAIGAVMAGPAGAIVGASAGPFWSRSLRRRGKRSLRTEGGAAQRYWPLPAKLRTAPLKRSWS
jgi:hypothetical protein